MKSYRNCLIPLLALAALAPLARAEKEVTIRRIDVDGPHGRHDEGLLENEKVTFLGVSTEPVQRTVSTQLGLLRDTGLVVTNIMDKSPAADVLKEDDILTKLDDQILVDTHQLGVLVRSHREGDEIKLTVLRGGKETTVKVKLGIHEVPKMANGFFFPRGNPGGGDWQGFANPEALANLERLHDLPGMGADDARDVLRMIGRERGNFLAGPGVHILGRRGKGSTVVDLPNSNISYSDDDGSIEIKSDDGKRSLTVKNGKGEVAFNGPINTDEERKKLPEDIKKRLEKLETDTISFEADRDFKPETVPLPPAKTKISVPVKRVIVIPSRSF